MGNYVKGTLRISTHKYDLLRAISHATKIPIAALIREAVDAVLIKKGAH